MARRWEATEEKKFCERLVHREMEGIGLQRERSRERVLHVLMFFLYLVFLLLASMQVLQPDAFVTSSPHALLHTHSQTEHEIMFMQAR